MDDFFEITKTSGLWVGHSSESVPPGHDSAVVPAVTLDDLGKQFDAELAGLRSHCIERTIKLGAILLEAKRIAGHGQWLSWLDERGLPDRTAQRWMAMARDPESARLEYANGKSAKLALFDQHAMPLPELSTEACENILVPPMTEAEMFKRVTVIKRERRVAREAERAQRQAEAVAANHPLQEASYKLIHATVQDIDPHIEDGSVDAIITDPPYSIEYIDCYHALAEMAARELKPGGHLLVMVGQLFLPTIVEALNKPPLQWRWMLGYDAGGANASVVAARVWNHWRPVLWLTNGPSDHGWVSDAFDSSGRDRALHKWQQNVDGFVQLVERFTVPNALVLDPFCGSGTTGVACLKTGRLFIGSDRDPTAIAVAAQRLSSVVLNGSLPESREIGVPERAA